MLVAQLGSSSRSARLLLVAYVFVAAAFGALAVSLRDWVAGAFCLLAVVGAVRAGTVLWRRRRHQAEAVEVVAARSAVVAAQGQLFVSQGHLVTGAWLQRGLVLIGPSRAAFVPVGSRSHLLLEAVITVFAARFRYVDLELYVSREGDLDAAIDAAVLRHGGFPLDRSWTYTPSQRWLTQPGGAGIVWIERAPPPEMLARWAETPRLTAAVVRARLIRFLKIGVALFTGFIVAGLAGWRWTDDTDFLISGVFYACLLGGTVIGGSIIGARRMAPRV